MATLKSLNIDGNLHEKSGTSSVSETYSDPPSTHPAQTFRTGKVMSTPASTYTKLGQTVVLYEDETDDEGYACVGTLVAETWTFGSLLNVPGTDTLKGISIAYDPDNDKVLTAWAQPGGNHYGSMAVGTVAGTGATSSISFGSHVTTNSGSMNIPDGGHKKQGIVWVGGIGGDTTNRLVMAMLNDGNATYGRATVVTISGTTPSFGAGGWANFTTAGQGAGDVCMAYVGSGQVVVAYIRNSTGYCRVGTVTGSSTNSIVWSTSEYQYAAGGVDPGWSGTKNSIDYDANAGKFLIAYVDSSINTHGRAKVGTVTGTGASASIAFGTEQVFDTNATDAISVVFQTTNNHFLISYNPGGAGNITAKAATISGTDVAFGTVKVIDTSNPDNISSSYDSHNDLIVTTWVDNQASDGSVASVDFSGSTATVDLSTGNYFEADLEGQSNIKTFTITETLAATRGIPFFLKITQGSVIRNFIWSQITNVKWPAGTGPTITATNNAVDILSFTTYDEGDTWYGETVGQNFS